MVSKISISRRIFSFFNILILTAVMLACLYPMLYVLFASLSDADELMEHSGFLLRPAGFTFSAYKAVSQNSLILSGYINTIFVVVVGCILSVTLSSIGAYFLSRRDVMLKNAVMYLMTFTMLFNGGLVPTYLLVQGMGLGNTLWSTILPCMVSAYNVIIMRTSFMGIPSSIEEAALIDGAGHIRVLVNIVLPLSKAVLAVMVLFYGVSYWNSWFNAMIYINQREKFPLQLVLREILIQNDTNAMLLGIGVDQEQSISETIKYAVIIVATVPILCIYPFLQKYFVQGVMVGAIKG